MAGRLARVLVGIDDTDNRESRGTGFRARQLGRELGGVGVHVRGISRHQLLVDDRIPYTSHNSAACLTLETESSVPEEATRQVVEWCREFLLRESAEGADAGLCVAPMARLGAEVAEFGRRAKRDVLASAEAERVARQAGFHLEGLTGTGLGVIGALAAVGLRAAGNDGRVLWLAGLRELEGVRTASDLVATLGLDAVETEDGRSVEPAARVDVGEWPRPILRGGRIVLIVERPSDTLATEDAGTRGRDASPGAKGDRKHGSVGHAENVDYRVAARERIKQLSG